MSRSQETAAQTTPARSPRRRRVRLRVVGLAAVAVLVAGATLLMGRPGPARDAGAAAFPIVHGLGVNPADGALYAAAHDGLYRIPATAGPVRVAGRVQDLVGFVVTGPDRFLASRHPDPDDTARLPTGLIGSTDAGQTWTTRSTSRSTDFHALDASSDTVYGYDASIAKLLVSGDGQAWRSTPLAAVTDVAVNPANSREVLATTVTGVTRSRDRGRTFAPPTDPLMLLLSWTLDGVLVGVTPQGLVQSSRDAGRSWGPLGSVGGTPQALTAAGDAVHVAVAGRILSSIDRGQTFTARGRG